MRQATLFYNCCVSASKVHLRIEHLLVADYPMTMTPRECLEEFCESVGWRFLECYEDRTGLRVYMLKYYEFRFERPKDKNIYATITAASFAHQASEGAIF